MNSANSITSSSRLITLSILCATTFSAGAVSDETGSDLSLIIPTITSVTFTDGQFLASGSATVVVRGENVTSSFTAPVSLARAAYPGLGCPFLDLGLNSVRLNFLGLIVETTPICDKIINFSFAEGDAGEMFCNLANLLHSGWTIDQVMTGESLIDSEGRVVIPGVDPSGVLATIQAILNTELLPLLQSTLQGTDSLPGSCPTLQLDLPSFPLTVLGLSFQVHACADDPVCGTSHDLNCYTGPITVSVSSQRGKENTLGNLVCGLSRGAVFSPGSTLADVLAEIQARLRP